MAFKPDVSELHTIYDAAPVGLCLISTDLRFLRINRRMADINGVAIERHIGASVRDVVPALEPIARHLMNELMETGEAVGPFEVVGKTPAQPGVERCWMETWAPVTNERGEIVAASIAAVEVTEQKRLEHERNSALAASSKRLAQQTALVALSQSALHDLDLDQVMEEAVRVAAAVLDLPMTKILRFAGSADHLKLVAGVGWQGGLVGVADVGTEKASQEGYTLLSSSPVVVDDLRTETRFSGPALLHQHNVRSGMSVVIAGPGDRAFGVFGVHTTERRSFDAADVDFLVALATIVTNAVRKEAAFAQRTLLVREIAHRAGNMLQLVSTIAGQTFRQIDNVETARRVFSERLASLARANNVISSEGWEATRFRAVVEQTLIVFKDRLELSGRDILLPPDLCFDLGLVLHELCTNSAKYGSLAQDEGAVKITWLTRPAQVGQLFEFVWSDDKTSSKAAHDSMPSTGFGSRLIELLLVKKWGGSISTSMDGGYVMTAAIPVPLT